MTEEQRRSKPDYDLEGVLEVREPEQYRAVGDPTRQRIINLLSEKAATNSQLAAALGQSKGSIGHHLKVLEGAGLIRVVRTRQVRAITEKYYGRTAWLFEFRGVGGIPSREPAVQLLQQAINEYVAPEAEERFNDIVTLAHARIPKDRAQEFAGRMWELVEEFRTLDGVPGEKVYGFVAGVYLTDLPELSGEEE